jgi:hypothetical protein
MDENPYRSPAERPEPPHHRLDRWWNVILGIRHGAGIGCLLLLLGVVAAWGALYVIIHFLNRP